MPNTKSAKKELRKAEKRTVYNKKIENKVKDLLKKSKKAIETKNQTAQELVKKASKELDKAAQKGVIKKNTCARKKSRLQLSLNKTLTK